MAKSRFFTLLLVFVFLFSGFMNSIEFGFAGNTRHVIIYLYQYDEDQKETIVNHYKNSDFPVIEVYKDFFLSKVDSQQEKFLKENKVNFSYMDGIGTLRFGGYVFKPDESKNIVYPNDLRGRLGNYSPNDEALFFLQFIGPVKEDWLALDKEKYDLYPINDFSFILKTTGNHASELRDIREVSMIGHMPPILKISHDLRAMDSGAVNLEIVTTPDFNLSAFLQRFNINSSLAEFHHLGRVGFLRLQGQHVQHLGSFAQYSKIVAISKQYDLEAFCDDVAQVINVRDENHDDKLGLTGANQIVAVADSGLSTGDRDTVHRAFQGTDKIVATLPDDPGDWSDSGTHGTAVSGIILGDDPEEQELRGMAYKASLIVQKLEFGGGANPTTAQLFSHAYDEGARVHNNSYGSANTNFYSPSSMVIDHYLWNNKDFNVVFAAGNWGPNAGTLSTQANAKNIFAVGGSQNNKPGLNINRVYHVGSGNSSSRGLTPDGRFNPDVVAPTQIIVAPGTGDSYINFGGTSGAAPVVSGALALLREKYGNRSSALFKAMLVNGTARFGLEDQNGATQTCPSPIFGWGRIDVERSTRDQEMAFWDVTGSEGLQTGHTWTTYIEVFSSTQPLRINLAYTDAPFITSSNTTDPVLINNLDLIVTDPNGVVYRGNQFNPSSFSIPNPSTTDDRNNVEEVWVSSPVEGDWTIAVSGVNIPEGDPNSGRQPFAVVASGGFSEPDPSDPDPEPMLQVQVVPYHREVIQGDSTQYQAILTSLNGAEGTVEIDSILGFGDPATTDISYSFPFGDSVYLQSGLSNSITFRIQTGEATPLGIYPNITLTAHLYDINEERTIPGVSTFRMTVIQEPTFFLNLRPSHARIRQGETAGTRITVLPRFEFNEYVYFDVSGLPPDSTYTLEPNPTSSGMLNEYRSQLTITTQRTTPEGVYPVSITGNAELPGGKEIQRTVVFNLEILPRISRRQVEIYRRSMPESLQIPCNERDRDQLTVRYRIQLRNVGNERLERNRIEIRLDPNLEFISSEPSGNFVDGILRINVYDLNEPRHERPGDCWPARDCSAIGYPGLSEIDGHYLIINARLSDAATRISSSTLLENRITFISDPYYTETFPFYSVLHPCPGAEHPLYFRAYVENLRPDGTVGVNEEVRIRFRIEGGSGEYTYHWNWGDGNTLTHQEIADEEVVLRHTYQRAGTYRIFIEARDSKGRYKKGEIVLRVQ